MASKYGAVWAIDIGNYSLKALHLSDARGVIEVIGFDNIQHSKVLNGEGVTEAERDELIALSLREFVRKNQVGKSEMVISVASQNSFARFVNLPPVEAKRIPEIVKFEAAQQIPFDINDVQWDWQLMSESDSPEIKVGIFAIKNEIVNAALEHFARENLQVGYVQMAPMALYNYLLYDRPELAKSENEATVILNIGAESSDLVVCTGSTVWQRSVPMGGNAFTRAIVGTFKLNFEKAEKLKRTAAMSKYARQIFQAMRPVFTDLASDIQRSLGFYSNSNPNVKLSRIIALGGGTRLRGLLKYLQQTLQIPVERPDSFNKLVIGSEVSAAKFHESVCDFGVVYGLGLQCMDLGRIESNLLPHSVARSAVWATKAKYFVFAALLLFLISALSLGRVLIDKGAYAKNSRQRQEIRSAIRAARDASGKLSDEEAKGSGFETRIQKGFELFKYRQIIPLLHQTIIQTLPSEKNTTDQKELYRAFDEGDVETVLRYPRKERKQVFITSLSVMFARDIDVANLSGTNLQSLGIIKEEEERETRESAGRKKMLERLGMKGGPGMGRGSPQTDPTQPGIKAGFLVSISGYIPNASPGELMEPVGVEGDKSQWGVVTRMLHLDEIVDGNSPFELFKKSEVDHFKLQIGEVDINAEMPEGIGIRDKVAVNWQSKNAGESVLVDPMTREIISTVADLDEYGVEKINRSGNIVYKVNDYWFTLDAKFVWKDAPKPK